MRHVAEDSRGNRRDLQLRDELRRLRGDHVDQWAYGERTSTTNASVLFQYPAMMVADMQRELTAALLKDVPRHDGPVFDPFIGSGTVLSAAMELGRDVVGWDVNPLAILICRVKAGPFHLAAFASATKRAIPSCPLPATPDEPFENWRHWFTDDVARGLTSIRQRIRSERNRATRRFLWLCLAETVRLSSNSRTSTVKLHRRPADQILARPDPRVVFARVVDANLARLATNAETLRRAGVLSRDGRYLGDVTLALGDTRTLEWSGEPCAAIVTSPPYGDNTSTVPYGQHAYLPLQWIDLVDVHRDADATCLSSTYEIDRRSLGGSKVVSEHDEVRLRAASPALDRLLDELASEPRDRRNRVAAFARDLDAALGSIAKGTPPGAAAAWTVGSRRVGGRVVRLAQILVELASSHGFAHIDTLQRTIPAHRKRMAARNRTGATIHREHVVILRRVQP